MAEKPRIVGIDLGTTNTLVASVRNSRWSRTYCLIEPCLYSLRITGLPR